MSEGLPLGVAARAIGVSVDTLRRWDRAGKLATVRDARNRRLVPAAEVERLSQRPRRQATGHALSARNRFPGVIRSVEADGVMAIVEIEAGSLPGFPAGAPGGPGGAPRAGGRRGAAAAEAAAGGGGGGGG